MIAKVSVISGADEGQSITVGAGQSVIIGRSKKTDFHIHDTSISRKHCRIVNDGTQCSIEDLGSMNGTLLNGQRLQGPKALYDRDQIVIGRTTLLFRIEMDDEYVPVEVGEEIGLNLESLAESFEPPKPTASSLESMDEPEAGESGVMLEEAAKEDAAMMTQPVSEEPDVSIEDLEPLGAPIESEVESLDRSAGSPNAFRAARTPGEHRPTESTPLPVDKETKQEKKELLLLPVLWEGVKVPLPVESPLMNGVQPVLNRRVTIWDTRQPLTPDLREQLCLIAQLNHPAFTRLLDLGVVNMKTYVAFAWMGEHSLEFYLQAENTTALHNHADTVGQQIYKAIKFAAARGIGFPVLQTHQIGFVPGTARVRIVPIAPLKIGAGQETIEKTCASSLSNVLELLASMTKPREGSWLARSVAVSKRIKSSLPTLPELFKEIDQIPT